MQQLILGSSSPFRAELMTKLGLDFIQASPDINESVQAGESPVELVQRLAEEKARAIALGYPQALIIGSDQVAVIDKRILGKPGNHDNAMQQLKQASGRQVDFLTALALFNARSGHMQSLVEPFRVHFKVLTETQIEYYLKQEQPYQCAGSFKAEGFGICLFSRLEGDDPNSLVGLPLIKLVQLLNTEGIDVLQPAQ